MKIGISGSVPAMISAEIQSCDADDHQHGRRDDHREKQLRKVEREVPVERVDAPRGQHGQLTGALSAEVRGPQRPETFEQRRPELRLGARAGVVGQQLPSPGDHGATHDHDEQGREREGEPGDSRVRAKRAGDYVGQQPRLGDDQHAR